jgi:peptide/nickel transport system permease protein
VTTKTLSKKVFNKRNTLIFVGGFIVLFVLLVAIFAPWIATHDPNVMSLENRYQPPSAEHYFGLDQDGSDVFSKVVYGSRISFYVAISVVSICLIIGLVVGSLAGYIGGKVDQYFMRFVDMLYAFPGFLLAISLVAVLGPSVHNLIFAMCATGWATYARLVRAEVLHLKYKEYVQSAKALGANPFRIVILHIWPNLVGPIVVQSSFAMAGTIISESSLSFLGLGAPPTTPTWGALLSAGRKILIEAPHVSIFPGLAIVLLVLGFNLFGDGLRDYLDPKKN